MSYGARVDGKGECGRASGRAFGLRDLNFELERKKTTESDKDDGNKSKSSFSLSETSLKR